QAASGGRALRAWRRALARRSGGDSSRAGPDSRVLRGALGFGRLRRFAGIPDPHQPDRLLPLPGDCPAGQSRLPVRVHQPRLPGAPVQGLSFEETETRYRLRPAQTVAGASEYGISEQFPLDGARSLYGMTKLAAELMVAEYGDASGIRFAIDRCGLLTGPWQMARADQGVVAYWAAAHRRNSGR